MRPRELIFGGVAAVLVIAYTIVGARLWPVIAPVAGEIGATPSPITSPVPARAHVPGTVAFAIAGDVYVLREGHYERHSTGAESLHPSLSADGTSLLFARRDQITGSRIVDGQRVEAYLGYTVIIRRTLATGAEQVVLNGLRQRAPNGFHTVAWYLSPVLSPNGRQMAVIEDLGDGAANLRLWDLQTQSLRQLSAGEDLADPAWSPDGTTIVVSRYTVGAPTLMLIAADGRSAGRAVTGLPVGDPYRPSYSPDGRWLIYTLRHDGKNDVHAFELATRRDIALTNDGRSWNGVFSFDGTRVAFLRERDGAIDLWTMELGDALTGGAAREPVKLTRSEGIDGSSRPSWSR